MDEERAAWLARTSEPAIEPDLPIVDSHHHLWDHEGDRYFLEELLADTGSGHNVVQTVYVECGEAYDTDVPAELAPLGETRWASAQAADSERRPGAVIAAVIGYADLRLGPDAVRRSLEAQVEAAGGRYVGIRHATAWDESPQVFDHRTHPTRGLLRDETFRRSFAVLGQMGLTFDAFCYHPQVPEVIDLARAFPDTTVVLDHLGSPVGVGPYADRRDEVLSWLDGQLAELASCPNAHLKLGGMGMPWFGSGWHRLPRPPGSDDVAESWGPFVRRCIEHFGPDRCMFESNFPVDRRSFPYVVAVNAFMRMTADLSPDERADVFAGTARRVYGIPTASPS